MVWSGQYRIRLIQSQAEEGKGHPALRTPRTGWEGWEENGGQEGEDHVKYVLCYARTH